MSFLPGIAEMRMAKAYFEKLKDPRWQKRRLEALNAGDWKCASCGDADNTLHVHHRQYFKGREPWEYELGQLEVLCEDCHAIEHEASVDDPLLVAASYVPTNGRPSRDVVASLVAGFCGQPMDSPHVGDPSTYIAGEIAKVLEVQCGVMPLLDLLDALKQRNRWTVQAAVDSFTQDLKTRPDAPAKPNTSNL